MSLRCLLQRAAFITLILLPISAFPTHSKHHERAEEQSSSSSVLRRQFSNPAEVLSVVLIIGGDIVQKAIAQMCGRTITPVAFSFGWVSYAFNSLMAVFGDGVLMPNPDFPAFVVTVNSGGKKSNESWLLSRLIRDLVKEEEKHFEKWENSQGKTESEGDSGLIITFLKIESDVGTVRWDRLSWSYFAILFVQLAIAAIPIGLDDNWIVMFITATGSLLALATGSIPEWRREKFACRTGSKDTYALTRGNGHKHVFVILNPLNADGKPQRVNLYLEDLAGSVQSADKFTRYTMAVFAVLWIMFLITVGSMSSSSGTWYLLGVGAVGMVQNIIVAGFSRSSGAHGIPMHIAPDAPKLGRRIKGQERPKVMDVLFSAEDAYPGLGLSLKDLFFPIGQQNSGEIAKWDARTQSLESRKEDKREANREAMLLEQKAKK